MKKATSFRLEKELIESCKVYAKAHGITVTDIITQGITLIIKDMPKPEIATPPSASAEIFEPFFARILNPFKPAM